MRQFEGVGGRWGVDVRGCLVWGCGGSILGVVALVGVVGILGQATALGSVGGAVVIAAAVVPALLYSLFLLQMDRYEREPARVLLAAFLWGALVATVVASLFNELSAEVFSSALQDEGLGGFLTAVIVAPVVEETAKGLVLLLLMWRLRNEFDDVVDGVVYGSLVGIGFAMSENILYFSDAYATGQLAALFYVRVGLNGLGHAGYTALTGAGLGYARETNRNATKLLLPALALMAAIVAHASWNLLGSISIGLVSGLDEDGVGFWVAAPFVVALLTGPVLVVLAIALGRAWRREKRVVAEFLRDEVQAGVLSEDAYARVTSSRARRKGEVLAWRRGGWRSWRALRRFNQALTELAFAKWRVSRGVRPERAQSVEDLRVKARRLGVAAGDAPGRPEEGGR